MKPEDKDPREESAETASSSEPPPSDSSDAPKVEPPAEDVVERGADAEGDADVEADAESRPDPASKPEKEEPPTYYDDPYSDDYYDEHAPYDQGESKAVVKTESAAPPPTPPPPPPGDDDKDDGDDDGMVRMSFLQHLEELRTRLMRAVIGLVLIYLGALAFAPDLFGIVVAPFTKAAQNLGQELKLTQLTPTEQFYVMYIKVPLLAAIFVGAPWLTYQAWGFIAPGLYKRERRWAVPFIFSTAGLFILGGVFCYYVALPLALTFLLGLGQGVQQMISLTSYYDMFFNLMVGLGVVFQMPLVVFFFTLLRITSPAFLIRNGRYAILIIFILAAVITPTPDVTTMLTFAAPMILLYYVGIGASYLLVLRREGRKFPWVPVLLALLALALLAGGAVWFLNVQMGWPFISSFPWIEPPSAP